MTKKNIILKQKYRLAADFHFILQDTGSLRGMAGVNLRGVGRVREALKHLPRRGRHDCGLLLIPKIKIREILKALRTFSHPQLWLE